VPITAPPTTTARNLRRYISIDQAADHLEVNPRTVRRRIADGTLTGYRFGPRLIRLDPAEVDALLRPIPTGGYPLPGSGPLGGTNVPR
jgi:excisionase family DNA binding protein